MSGCQLWKIGLISIVLFLIISVTALKTATAAELEPDLSQVALSWMQYSYIYQGVYPPKLEATRQWVSHRDALIIGIRLMGLERKASRMSSPDRYMEIAQEIGLLEKLEPGADEASPGWWEMPASRAWTARWLISLLDLTAASDEGELSPDYRDSELIPLELRADVAKAQKMGLLAGYPDGSFKPEASISFNEMAILVTRTAYQRGKGSQTIKGTIKDVNQRNLLISDSTNGHTEWYSLNQWAWINDQGVNISLDDVTPGRDALLMLHDNREVSVLELLGTASLSDSSTGKTDQSWRDIADYLVFTSEAPNNVNQLTQAPFDFRYHNQFPIQGNKSFAYDGSAYWVYAPYHQQIFLYDSQGVHRQTLELPDWLKIDALVNDSHSIMAVNQSSKQWYRLRPVYYPLPSTIKPEETGSVKNDNTTISPSQTALPLSPPDSSIPRRYCLLFCGGMEKQTVNHYSKIDLQPLVAYVDPQGKIKDTYFNSFVMLSQYSPLLNGRPMGRDLPQLGESPVGPEDWQAVFDEYFAEKKNLDALEAAAGELSKTLNRPEYQVEVYLGVPTPQPNSPAWPGFVSNNQLPLENMNFRVPEVYSVWWAMRGLNERFQKRGFEHLKLAGFYYQTEQGYPGDTVQESFPLLCRYLGLRSLAIPGVSSSYPLNFQKDGFDTLLIQSSHVFAEVPQRYPRIYLDEAAIIAREGPTGFMIELPYDLKVPLSRKRLDETLQSLHDLPVSKPIGCFQGFNYLSQLSRSETALREIYDRVYQAVSRDR